MMHFLIFFFWKYYAIQAFALSEAVRYHPIVWYWKQYGMGPYLWVSSIGFLLRTSFCNTTPLQITCFCVKGYTLVRIHRVTVLSGIGVHSRQRGGDLRKCLKANSLPQIGWHLGCWDWGNSMLRLLPLLGLAAALPMVPSDQSSVSFFCV